MKHKPHQKEKKALSVTGLLSLVRDIFSESGAWLNRDGIAFLKLQR